MANIQILAGVIHELKKTAHSSGEGSTDFISRDSLHDENDLLNQFVNKIDADSRKASRVTSKSARFTQDDTISKTILNHFENVRRQNFDKSDFLDFSITLVEAFKEHMQNTSSATGGYIPVLWYKRDEQEFLLIGTVNPTGGFTIDDNGDIIRNTNIDEAALRFSVSVELENFLAHYNNLNNAQNTAESIINYVRWTTKRNNEISHYFQDFVPTDITIDDGKATNNFINYCNKYLNNIIPDSTTDKSRIIDTFQQNIYRYLLEKGENGRSVDIDTEIVPMFEHLINSHPIIFEDPEEVIDFSTFCNEQGLDNYKSIFHPSISTVKSQINVNIAIKNSIKIKGTLTEIIEATELVVNNTNPDDIKYGILLELTKNEYDTIKANNPSISLKNSLDETTDSES